MSQITTREFGYNAKHTSVSSQEMDTNLIYINDELKNKLVESDLYDNNTIQSLHKSPNAITSMFIYDTSKDSDGGAWTDKCQNTSWYNETLSGSWLGQKLSEIDARCYNATLGADIAVNGSFTTDTNWTKGTGVTINNGTAIFTSVADNVGLTAAVAPLTTNLYYTITFTISSYVTGSVEILLGTTSVLFPTITNGTYTVSGIANSTAFVFRANGTSTYNVDNITIKPVTTLSTLPNDYFQLISDGKFYSLSKNYFTTTATLATQTQFLTAGTYTISSTTASSGSVAISGAATATHTAGTSTTFTVTTSGLVVFTVTGSVLTAQVELGISATTYSANTSTTRYSETFRGNKKEFPKLSAIIAEAANVTIYDLTEKNNPMWMRFIVTANPGGAIGWNSSIKDVKCLNNLLVICHYGSNYRDVLHNIEFIKDTTITSGTSANIISYPTEFGINGNNISQRNVVGKFSGIGAYILYDSGVTNISMSILKNAPIDTITGLKIPTIALGSDTKCTIITNTGTIIQTPNVGLRIPVLNKKSLITARNNSSDIFFNNNPELLSNNFTENTFNNTTGPDFNASVCPDIISFKNNTYIRRTTAITPSIIQLLRHNNNNFVKGIAATITNNSNTGYQVGDIRRTYLSSNTVETITNTELLSNSSFTDSSAWTITAGLGVTIANGKLNFDGVTSITNAATIISQNVNTIAGKTYKIVIRGNITGVLGAYIGGIYQELPNIMTNIPWFVTANSTGANTFSIRKRNGNGVVIGYIDSISMVEQYIEDRSYKAKAADIYGTLTKTAVNTGTDLVEYSGFSNTNYIRENYSNDLDFATGEFNISSWVKFTELGALGQTNRGWYGMTTLGTDVYCTVFNGDIYKQTNGTGNFIALGQISREWRAMTTLGTDVYCTVFNGDIYKQTNGTGNFIALGQTTRQWYGMTTLGSDVYGCVYNGDIYKRNNSTGVFEPLLQTIRNWHGMTTLGTDVYASVVGGDIYKQTNGTDNFIALGQTSRLWYGMTTLGTDVYACVYNGDIYKQTNGTGNFIALGQTSRQWIGMTTLGTDVYACVYNGDIYKLTPEMLTSKTIVERSYPTGPKISLTATNGGYVTANLYDGTTTKSVTTTNSFTTGIPAKVSASYKFGKLGIMVNGQEVATNLGLPLKALSGAWEEKAPQLNAQTAIFSLAVFNGKLYGGTGPNGRLFEWNGSNAWIEVAPQLNAQTAIYSLAVFNGKLYGGTYPNGKLFEWNGSNAWVEVAPQLNSQNYIYSLAEYNGKLYGGTGTNGKLFEWNGTNAWVEVAPQLNSQTYIMSLAVFNGKLYGGTFPNGKLFEWNGSNAWIEVAPQLNSQNYIYSLAEYNGKLYGGTGPNGRLFEWNGSNAWIEVAPQLNAQTTIWSLAVFNGKLYGGTYPNGKLFEWNGSNAWVEVANLLNAQTHIYSLAVYNNGSGDKLYGGTYPNSKLFEWNGYGTDATLTIGNSTDLTAPFPGSLSLLKISGTVPTKEQELFMYEQEKQLFNENTKCTLPDDTVINDISYDDITDTWKTNSNTNYSTWNNLVRTSNTAPIQGTFANTTSNSGVILQQRDLGVSLDGYVDVILPKYSVYKDFINNYNNANNVNLEPLTLDFIAGFQGTLTVGTNSITSITTITYPTDIIGATITGTNIPANTTIIDISGTTLYISNLITQGAGVNDISFKDYILPSGYEAILVTISGNTKIEGSTKDYTKLYDGFAETVSFNTAPAYTLPVQIQIIKDI